MADGDESEVVVVNKVLQTVFIDSSGQLEDLAEQKI